MIKGLFFSKRLLIFIVLLLFMQGHAVVADCLEGGYVGGNEALATVYAFLDGIDYEQFYWAEGYMFLDENNSYIDSVNIAFYAGNGGPWMITSFDNAIIDLTMVSSNNGWGDVNLRYITFYTPNVILTPLETSDWYSGLDNIFSGLRQACGYRTPVTMAVGASISDYYTSHIASTGYIWQSWFMANNLYGASGMYTAAVMHSEATNDRWDSCQIPPAPDDGSFTIYYQH